MNGNRIFKSLRLVRFGDVLYDQQRRLILLCRSCQRHYLTLETFQMHLSKCSAIKHIVTSIDELHYEEDKRKTRLINGKQEMFIYEPDAVRNNSIDWEAELEDPRWYTDDNRVQAAKAKSPPTNAKENYDQICTRLMASNDLEKDKQVKQAPRQIDKPELTLSLNKRLRLPPKRTTLSSQQPARSKRISLLAPTPKVNASVEPDTSEDLSEEPALTIIARLGSTPKTAAADTSMVSIPAGNTTTEGDTQQILNKLRACGVEVKRRNTRETPEETVDAQALSKRQQTLEIMRKLQSNGIMCTKVKKIRKNI